MTAGLTRANPISVVRCRSSRFLVLGVFVLLVASAADDPRKNVLVINEIGQAYPAIALVTGRVMSHMAADQRCQIESE